MATSESLDPVKQLAHFIVEQFVGTHNDFLSNKTDYLLHLTKEPAKASKERLLILLEDKETKSEKNNNSCNKADYGKSPLFFTF